MISVASLQIAFPFFPTLKKTHSLIATLAERAIYIFQNKIKSKMPFGANLEKSLNNYI